MGCEKTVAAYARMVANVIAAPQNAIVFDDHMGLDDICLQYEAVPTHGGIVIMCLWVDETDKIIAPPQAVKKHIPARLVHLTIAERAK